MSDTSTFEAELLEHGKIIYTNVGVSMMPLLRQNRDVMIIERPTGRLKKYDVPLFKRDNGRYVLHRILKVRENDYVICGDNCTNKEYGITDEHIIGVLTGVIRDGKILNMNDFSYKLYYHLWCDFFYVRVFLIRLRNLFRKVKRFIKRKRGKKKNG